MRLVDLLKFAWGGLYGQRLRSSLSALGVAVGVSAVILLTSLGEGTREYVLAQFTQFGTNLVTVNPGKVETFGIPGALGGTTRKLTVDDALALYRIPGVSGVVPVVMGQAKVEWGKMARSVYIYGVGHEAPRVWKFEVGQGRFLPDIEPSRDVPVCVLGPKLARELFGPRNPLGEKVRIGGAPFRVVGVMAPKGQLLGFDLDDAAYVMTGSGMRLFNLDELGEIDVLVSGRSDVDQVAEAVRRLLVRRHRGEEDFTITTQKDMLAAFDRILHVLTLAVAGIAGISLLVGAAGIVTVVWISVNERVHEIGLLRALGLSARGVAAVFVAESVALGVAGGMGGLLFAGFVAMAAKFFLPSLPMVIPVPAVFGALAMSFWVGLLSSVGPALRASRLDPVEALRAE